MLQPIPLTFSKVRIMFLALNYVIFITVIDYLKKRLSLNTAILLCLIFMVNLFLNKESNSINFPYIPFYAYKT